MTYWLALVKCVPDWRIKELTAANCHKIFAKNSNKLQSHLICFYDSLAWIHKLIMYICKRDISNYRHFISFFSFLLFFFVLVYAFFVYFSYQTIFCSSILPTFCVSMLVNAFKNGSSKICGREPSHITSNFLEAVFQV